MYIYRRANEVYIYYIYISKSCNLQLKDSLFLFPFFLPFNNFSFFPSNLFLNGKHMSHLKVGPIFLCPLITSL